MRKSILIVLMLGMFDTPCLAQEVKTDGLFSLEGTTWQLLPVTLVVFWPFPVPIPLPVPIFDVQSRWGFYGGEVYPYLTSDEVRKSFYLDLGLVSIFMYEREVPSYPITGYTEMGFGIVNQPLGIGPITIHLKSSEPSPLNTSTMGVIVRVNEHWVPEEIAAEKE